MALCFALFVFFFVILKPSHLFKKNLYWHQIRHCTSEKFTQKLDLVPSLNFKHLTTLHLLLILSSDSLKVGVFRFLSVFNLLQWKIPLN